MAMPKSRKRKVRKPTTHHGAEHRRQLPPELARSVSVLDAVNAAEARGDAVAAIDLMADHLRGPDGEVFWAPWRIRMLLEIAEAGPELPGWAISRWILAQSLRHLRGNTDRMTARPTQRDECGKSATVGYMGSIASRDLRNHTSDVLERVREGERVAVTVHGEVVAELVPPASRRPRFLTKAELGHLLATSTADPALRKDLAALGDESTEDLGELE